MKEQIHLNPFQRTLVEENLHIVSQTLTRNIRCNESICGMGYEDLFQEGALALCRAAATYDYEQYRTPFSAYARPVVRNYLLDYCRRLLTRRNHLPTIPLHAQGNEESPPPEQWLPSPDDRDAWDARILVDELLEHGSRTYTGVTRLGVEALALKVKGYSGADIARLYHTKPNHVGAWISRASKKMKADTYAASLLGIEQISKAAGF